MKSNIKYGMIAINEIKTNPQNPRIIRDKAFHKLKSSIRNFPEMLNIRPVVIDENNMVIGGNMRLAVVKDLGWEILTLLDLQ